MARRKPAAATAFGQMGQGPQPLRLGMPGGALKLPTPAQTRRPTRATLGGATPRAGRMRLPPAIGGNVGTRGGGGTAKKTTTTTRKKKTP